LEEKDKTIQSLKNKIKIVVVDHSQTEELLTLQREKYSFQQEISNLKAKILQIENEKEQLQKEKDNLMLTIVSTSSTQEQVISTDKLTKAMSQVSLKDAEIKKIKEKNNQIYQQNKNL
jgi:FtsZ-binding cell division protein ZapB